jgi:phage baseplate assembly protein W
MIGFTMPFRRSYSGVGHFQTTTDIVEIAAADLKSLILTNRGERVMRASFGCSLRDFLFEQLAGSELTSAVIDRIESQVASHLPYLEIRDIQVSQVGQENSMKIEVKFAIVGRPDSTGVVSAQVGA